MGKVKAYYKHELSSLTASSTASGYSVDNLLIFLESSLWKGVGTGDHTITFDAGANKTIGADYLGIANHNLAGATVMLQHSNDNFSGDINDAWDYNISEFLTSVFDASATSPTDISYASDGTLWVTTDNNNKIYNIQTDGILISSFLTSVFDASATSPQGISYASDGTLWVCDFDTVKIYNIQSPIPIDNKPFLQEFDLISSRYWRIKLSNLSSVPFMGIAYWGLSSEWDYPSLFDPNAESNKANINVSPTGYLLAINNKFIERSIRLKFKRADDGGALWLALKQWWDNHGLNLLFIAWDIDNHPDDIYFVYPDPSFKGPFTTANRREVSLTFKGRVSR